MKKVLLGVHSISADEKQERQIRKVAKYYPHPCYNKTEKINDLMLLKLDKPVKRTNTVDYFNLKTAAKEPEDGTKCTVAGWGETKPNLKKMSEVLMAVNVTVINRMKCNSPSYYDFNPIINKDMICAGSNGKDKADSCRGDSGGPLLCDGQLVGVTSFGGGCGIIKKPGVYTFLSAKYIFWIKKTMKKSD
uniref:Peptidase S1 domain-containing protein n=1 Tax=Cynoglossus semilaevis TaxID=244447 RepID=A0A3P8V6E7_CYNSE